MPPKYSEWGLHRRAKWLKKRGVRRYITAPNLLPPRALEPYGLKEVDPLPLCQAKAAELALALLPQPPHLRRVSIGGERVDHISAALAEALCPQVGSLFLDFDKGGEALGAHLRRTFGAPPPPPGPVFLSVELSPRNPLGEKTLRLWGQPDLQGLSLTIEGGLPPEPPPLSHLTLLWESGRVPLSHIFPCPAGQESRKTLTDGL